MRPFSTELLKAFDIKIGSVEIAIAVFINTASAPISMASLAWLGFPMPASIITGTIACSIIISI